MATMLMQPRPVIAVVGPAGAGKTRMLAAAVQAWNQAGVTVYGVGPSASAARQLRDGAGTAADTLHKLVYEHSTKQTEGRGPADPEWDLPERSVVIIDEAGMVDTRLLNEYAQIAQAKKWRTILVGDHRQLDAVDAGGMFAELVNDARNGDRWIVNAGIRDELYVTNPDNGHRHALPADFIAAGNVTVDYASTINRAQGATVDEAHVIINDRTNAKQLYVAATRGRTANHLHTAPPEFDLDDHSLKDRDDSTAAEAMAAALKREPEASSAIARRRQLRNLAADSNEPQRRHEPIVAGVTIDPDKAVIEGAAAAIRRLQRTRYPRAGQSLGR